MQRRRVLWLCQPCLLVGHGCHSRGTRSQSEAQDSSLAMTRSKPDSLSSPTAASHRATAMPKSCLFIAVLVALSFTLGCNKKPKGAAEATTLALTPEETLAQQAINLLNEATQLMTSVRDRASAAAAAPRLK